MQSLVLIIPADLRDDANALGAALGMGSDNFSVPLSADGSEPATHWGLHTWASEEFQQMIETGYYPPEVAEAGITEAEYDAMKAVLISSFWPDYVNHFSTLCAENGLQMVAVE